MKKVIGIINDLQVEFDESSVEKGCGGSETWVIEIAKEFVKQGYYVYVFSTNPCWHMSSGGVEYSPITNLDYILSFQHIDYFLVSRFISDYTLQILKNNSERLNNNIYPIVHDVVYSINYKYLNFHNEELMAKYDFFMNNIVKIDCMSNCGIQMLKDLCETETEKCIVIKNARCVH